MMLLHHDSRPYAIAAREAASFAKNNLQKLIEQGRAQATRVLAHVASNQPTDRLVRARALEFRPAPSAGVCVGFGGIDQPLHPHALQQATAKVDLPWSFAQSLRETDRRPWGDALLAKNLNELFERLAVPKDEKFLLRSTAGEVRGFLSSRYRRLDARPLLESFALACSQLGAVPIDGLLSDTRVAIEVLLPNIYEPIADEPMCIGLHFENSDYGASALSVRSFVVRLVCTNRLIARDALREVHLGRRLTDDIVWSEKTLRADTRAMSLAVGDVVRRQLEPDAVDGLLRMIRAAHEKQIAPAQVGNLLRKALAKSELERVQDLFENEPDVQVLPAGRTAWRLSNAISWLAGRTEDPDRRIDLMKTAGAVLPTT